METSVKAAEVLVTSQPDLVPHLTSSADQENAGAEAAAAACGSSPDFFDPMLEFSRRLDDIISTYGSSTGLLDKQHRSCAEAALDTTKEWTTDDITVTVETDVSLIKQSLNKLSSPEDRVEDLLRRYAELAASRRGGDRKLCVLQQTCAALQEEKQQLQAECRSGAAARSKLEALCRELQSHYNTLREETLQRCREDEEKRDEITCHFQKMLTDIQAQIEQHSSRNDKLCRENANLTDKLESLMSQCETREESLEKISRHHDLQNKLTEAKLQEANALLAAAEEKHKREKEYLLVQAAEWKLQAQTLREQGTVMQAQLTLYGQKFDEFQATLAKSNEIYVHFKKEMDNMSDKMKKMEKESNLWKMRFENCNKALTDMIEERTEKGKEYDLFVLKIQRLEKLCRALQDERKVLYDKIKEVRYSNSQPPTNVNVPDITLSDPTDQPALLTPGEMQELQDQDPVLTKDMDRLRQEQARLQEFAACLMTTPENHQEDNHDIDLEEDVMASAFFHFNTKREVKEAPVPDPEPLEDVKPEASDADLLPVDQVEKVPQADVSTPTSEETSAVKPTDLNPDAVKGETPEEVKEQRRIQTDEETETQSQSQTQTQTQTPSGQEPTPETEPPSEPNPNTAESEVLEEPGEVQQLVSEEPSKLPEFPAAESAAASDPDDCCKKQTPKKKKKKSAKSSS